MLWAIVLGGLGCSDPGARSAATSDATIEAMTKLDDQTSAVRDAVIRGDLADARSRAGQAAEGYVPVPGAPEGADQAMKLALAEVSGAPTLEQAARGLGQVAAACASCHSAMGVGGPDRPVWHVEAHPTEMVRHAMHVDQLWLALVRPSDDDLRAAVDVIGQAAAAPEATGVDLRVRDLAQGVAAAPPERRGEAFAALVTACAGCHAPGDPIARPRMEGVPLPPMADEMSEHFVKALELQLAVIAGDPAAVKRAGTAVAVRKQDERYPAAAEPFLDEIRRQGLRAATAPTLEDAAAAVGSLAVACGSCHTATGGGPKDVMPAPPAEPDMAKHLFGAYWMIHGLQAPDERAWVGGAEALAAAPLVPESAGGSVDGLDEKVHALAAQAATTTEPAARAAVLGKLLVSCAPCHQKLAP
jgi:mono/diheme cytochrome c family protein